MDPQNAPHTQRYNNHGGEAFAIRENYFIQHRMNVIVKIEDTVILICFDDCYAPAACVMLTSLLSNNAMNDFDLYAMTKNLREPNRRALQEVAGNYGRTIRFISMDIFYPLRV